MSALFRASAFIVTVLLATAAASSLEAQAVRQTNGSDTFIAGSAGLPELQAPGDIFVSGGALVTKGRVAGDAHVAGFDLDLEADVAGDLYAAGAAVTLRAPVAGDLSMMGFSLRTADTSVTSGNTRMLGSSITIDGDIGGALAATGGQITLNAAVSGDALLQGGSISFGPRARISGTLTYSAPEPVIIPADVIPAAKVVYQKTPPLMDRFEHMRDWGKDWARRDMPALPSTLALVWTFLVTLGFLVLLGGALLALAPQRCEALRLAGTRRPALMILLGVLGLATLLGLIPVAAMTVIGLPFLPIVVLAILVIWTLGYVFGAYVVALRLYQAFGGHEDVGLAARIALLGGAVLVFALLNFVPFMGWIVNFLLVLFGIGALSTGVLRALVARLPQELGTGQPPPPPIAVG